MESHYQASVKDFGPARQKKQKAADLKHLTLAQ